MGYRNGNIVFRNRILVYRRRLRLPTDGTGWGFWLLIPGFGAVGTGLAMVLRIMYGDDLG